MSMVITTSRPILMHTSLAYLSPEIQTLDSVISSRDACLPTELLSLIRFHLLSLITTCLLRDSTCALTKYENSLRELLCLDCVTYNQDIYGPDIWQWEQFSGACACETVPGVNIFNRTSGPSAYDPVRFKPNPTLFRDRTHWLENHLSIQSQRITGLQIHFDSRSKLIWRVVEKVLDIQDCRVLCGGHSIYNELLRAKTFPQRRSFVTIIPTVSRLDKGEGSGKGGLDGGCRDSVAVLHHARQNLALDFVYDYEDLETPPTASHARPLPNLLCELYFDSSSLYGFIFYAQSVVVNTNPLQALAALITVCISLPLTLATLVLTILCFYSRPQSFRVL